MASTPNNAKEWLERYEKKYQRAYDNYQATGDAKYDRQIWEYECICDAFRALIEKREQHDADMKKRRKNCNWVTGSLLKHTYDRDEVIKLLNDAVFW